MLNIVVMVVIILLYYNECYEWVDFTYLYSFPPSGACCYIHICGIVLLCTYSGYCTCVLHNTYAYGWVPRGWGGACYFLVVSYY